MESGDITKLCNNYFTSGLDFGFLLGFFFAQGKKEGDLPVKLIFNSRIEAIDYSLENSKLKEVLRFMKGENN